MSNKENEYFNFLDNLNINTLNNSSLVGKSHINQLVMLKISSFLHKFPNISYFHLTLMYGTNPYQDENPGEKPFIKSEISAQQKLIKNFNFQNRFNFSRGKIEGVYNKFTFKQKIDEFEQMLHYYPDSFTSKDFQNWCFEKIIYKNQMTGENFFNEKELKLMDFLLLQEKLEDDNSSNHIKSKHKI